MPFELRDCRREDLPQLVAINEAAVPAVNSLSLEGIDGLIRKSLACRIALLGYGIVGFMLLFGADTDHDA